MWHLAALRYFQKQDLSGKGDEVLLPFALFYKMSWNVELCHCIVVFFYYFQKQYLTGTHRCHYQLLLAAYLDD
jgi:hypothetical protein